MQTVLQNRIIEEELDDSAGKKINIFFAGRKNQ